jgi:FAD/FMN-containing dehydrogenase
MLIGKVSHPNSTIYNNQSASYWAGQESSLFPVCRIAPDCAEDVSAILNILVPHNTPFAVKSGGHMPWAGSANINGSGVTIDLSNINDVSFGASQTMPVDGLVSLGEG